MLEIMANKDADWFFSRKAGRISKILIDNSKKEDQKPYFSMQTRQKQRLFEAIGARFTVIHQRKWPQ